MCLHKKVVKKDWIVKGAIKKVKMLKNGKKKIRKNSSMALVLRSIKFDLLNLSKYNLCKKDYSAFLFLKSRKLLFRYCLACTKIEVCCIRLLQFGNLVPITLQFEEISQSSKFSKDSTHVLNSWFVDLSQFLLHT